MTFCSPYYLWSSPIRKKLIWNMYEIRLHAKRMWLDIHMDACTPYELFVCNYNDVIMDALASQIISLTIVYSTFYSDEDQRKHRSSASLAFVRGIHRAVTRKMFPFDDFIMIWTFCLWKNVQCGVVKILTAFTWRFCIITSYKVHLNCNRISYGLIMYVMSINNVMQRNFFGNII